MRPGFKKYPAGSFEYIQGSASKVDPEAKSVSITTASGEVKQSYDILVVATGSHTIGEAPWKNPGSYESGVERLHKFQGLVKNAKSIVLGGAGPTGVECAAELGFEYGNKKEITLVSLLTIGAS